jgi:hypothetical protein
MKRRGEFGDAERQQASFLQVLDHRFIAVPGPIEMPRSALLLGRSNSPNQTHE